MKKIILVLGVLLITFSASAQKKNAKMQFEVDGICGMCKVRIEKAALKTKGVKYASWNVQTHQLSLIIDERKTSIKKIKENIVAVGHESEGFVSTDEAYNSLDACCKYKDEEVVKNHK